MAKLSKKNTILLGIFGDGSSQSDHLIGGPILSKR